MTNPIRIKDAQRAFAQQVEVGMERLRYEHGERIRASIEEQRARKRLEDREAGR